MFEDIKKQLLMKKKILSYEILYSIQIRTNFQQGGLSFSFNGPFDFGNLSSTPVKNLGLSCTDDAFLLALPDHQIGKRSG